MWKVVGPHPHWEGQAKKMWSPIPVTRSDPVKLPFLEVTPTTVLERLRGQSDKEHVLEEDRSALALWSTEPIDLSRTTPPDFGGYRGVYLGKLRSGSALGRPGNAEKSYALLPNKFASGGVGSARASERGGLSSPQISSPGHCRKLNALQPLDQGDPSQGGGAPPLGPLSRIPILRSARVSFTTEVVPFVPEDEDEEEGEQEQEEEEVEEMEEEEVVEEEVKEEEAEEREGDGEGEKEDRGEPVQEILPEKEGETLEERRKEGEKEEADKEVCGGDTVEEELEEVEEEEEVVKKEEEEEEEKEGERDSGISSVVSPPHMEGRVSSGETISPSSERKRPETSPPTDETRGQTSGSDSPPTNGGSPPSSGGERTPPEREEGAMSTAQRRRVSRASQQGRHSADPPPTVQLRPQKGNAGKFRKESPASLPASLNVRRGKGLSLNPPRHKEEIHFKNLNYESDFESEDESSVGKSRNSSAAARMKQLTKKRDSMRELERRLTQRKISDRETERLKEERRRKYHELEERHNSGSSLPITRPGPSTLKPSTLRLPKKDLPKSHSHDRNLSQGVSQAPPPNDRPRPASLDRLQAGSPPKPSFSRAPIQQRRQIRATGRSPDPRFNSDTPTSRRSTPGKGLGRYSEPLFSRNSSYPMSPSCFLGSPSPNAGNAMGHPLRSSVSETNLDVPRDGNVDSLLILGGKENQLLKSYLASHKGAQLTPRADTRVPATTPIRDKKIAPSFSVGKAQAQHKSLPSKPATTATTSTKTATTTNVKAPNSSPNVVPTIPQPPLPQQPQRQQQKQQQKQQPPKPPPTLPLPSSKKGSNQPGYFEIPLDTVEKQTSLQNVRDQRAPLVRRPPTLPSSSLIKRKPPVSPSTLSKNGQLSEADIPTSCFQTRKVLNTIHDSNFKPFGNPSEVFRDNMELLKSDEWEEQVEGLQTIARLAEFHPEVVLRDLKVINQFLMKHAKNLRSQVCRTAIQTITQFFLSLQKNMEQDLEKLVPLLLQRTADTNKFLKQDSNGALDAMVEVVTPGKALTALINEGVGHKNPQVRTSTGRLLSYFTERLGAAKALQQRDVAEKLIPAATKLAQEGSLETRQMAKLTFQRLSTQPQFESSLEKYISSEDRKGLNKFFQNMFSESRGGGDTARMKASKGGRFR